VALDSGNPPFAAVIVCDKKMIASVANDSRTTGNPLLIKSGRAALSV
jgi:tRNA(Arg) A34 adenosine deaminase TadA